MEAVATPARRPFTGAGRDRQRGIALLTALFVVALVSVAAAAVYASQSLALKRVANQLDGEQAWSYALGLEDLVRNVLVLDNKLAPGYDGLDDVWARQNVVFPVQNGTLSGRIVDLQGAFNLNNLTLDDPNKTQTLAFARMVDDVIQKLNVPTTSRSGQRLGSGTDVAQAVKDWADPDNESSGTGGAENSDYLSAIPPLRTAGRLLLDVSEVRTVKGMTPELYAALTHCGPQGQSCISALPLVRATPTGGNAPFAPSPININTAPIFVLRAIPNVAPSAVTQFDASRKGSPCKDMSKIRQSLGIPTPPATPDPFPLDIKSSWFRLESISAVGGTQVAMYSTLFRPPAGGQPGVYIHSTAPG